MLITLCNKICKFFVQNFCKEFIVCFKRCKAVLTGTILRLQIYVYIVIV